MFETEIDSMTEHERQLYIKKLQEPNSEKWSVTFFFEDFEKLSAIRYSDIPIPPVNSKVVIRNSHVMPHPHYDYNKRNYWMVREVLPVLQPADITKDQLVYDNKINYEVYLIRCED